MNILALYRNLKVQDRERVILFRSPAGLVLSCMSDAETLSAIRPSSIHKRGTSVWSDVHAGPIFEGLRRMGRTFAEIRLTRGQIVGILA